MNMKMRNRIVICLGALAAVAATTNTTVNTFERPTAKVTAKIIDETGAPVVNVNVRFFFSGAMNDNAVVKVEGVTDVQGEFTGEGHCRREIGTSVTKEGCYAGTVNIPKFQEHKEGKWQPWNSTAVTILRPIGKPVALYAKTIRTQIPVFDQPCGYDLELGDWVAPYGKGMTKDFIFTLHQEWRGNYDYDVRGELTFKNPLDGFQETTIPEAGKNSAFRWERLAPENGYEPKFQLQNTWYPTGSDKKPVRSFKSQDEWQGYFFRVRTVEQDGKIVSAHYGKIRGGIAVYPNDPKPKIVFTYYFNPTPNDRNLEWDTKKNLFGSLTDMESPREP
jgi:hypothetical protein